MWTGIVESIHIAPAAKATIQSVEQAEAIPGVGLDGDRYAKRQGTFFKPLPDFELTLIEAEAVEALKRAVRSVNPKVKEFEASCFDGYYVTGDVTADYLSHLAAERDEARGEADADLAEFESRVVAG